MYWLPPEWYRHRGTITTYPQSKEDFFSDLGEVQEQFLEFVKYISYSEKLFINVNNIDNKNELEKKLKKKDIQNVEIFINPTNDVWCRDNCPIFVKDKNGKTVALKFRFNAWGGKYNYELDEEAGNKITQFLNIPKINIDMVLEGGSIDVNGNGSLLTTESCLLNKNRNPNLTKKEIEDKLKFYFGVKNILWLENGIVGDDTDGHIDDITRFVSSDTILTAIETDKNDDNYEILKESYHRLKHFKDINSKNFNVITVPMPEPIYYQYPDETEKRRLPASYINFYITNKFVLVPIFNCDRDREAINIIQSVFKDRKVVGLKADKIIIGLGAFHCLTQQVI